ncbi:MAG: M67 family metallopeptidase [Actinomycetota bacterium]
MESWKLPEFMADEMIAHANLEYPNECCGVLAGDGSGPQKLYRLRNVAKDPVMRYDADPKELKRVYDDLYELDWEVVCVYHSHTHTPAFPSPTDVERALHPDAVYALVSLKDRQNPVLRAFRIIEGTITELDVVRS